MKSVSILLEFATLKYRLDSQPVKTDMRMSNVVRRIKWYIRIADA